MSIITRFPFKLFLSLSLFIFVISCTAQQEKSDYHSAKKENIITEFYRIWDAADVEAFEHVLSKDLVDHERAGKGDKSDFQNMVDATLYIHSGFSEVKHVPLQVYYEKDNKVIVYWEHTARHTGDFAGFVATNKPVKMKGVDIFQIANGKISEIWHVEAIHEVLAQIRG